MKRVVFTLVLILLLVGSLELVANAGTLLLTQHGAMAYIPRLTDNEISELLTKIDPHVGWGTKTDQSGKVANLSPRTDPSFTLNQPPCASVYGDSFTFGSGDGVGPDNTYPHHLGLNLGCPVYNYGIGGYGSDQSLMLYRAQSDLENAPLIIVGHLTENILRNVNQYRNLLYPQSVEGFKPRFLLEANQLRFVPVPVRSVKDFRVLEQNPSLVLPYDAFVDRPLRSFPYTISLVHWLLKDQHPRAKLLNRPRYLTFYELEHPSKGLQITIEILATFVEDARAQGKIPIVLIIPVADDLKYAQEKGIWPEQNLVDGLTEIGIPTIHAGPAILDNLNGLDPCTLYQPCNGHFTSAGYKLLADIVSNEIRTGGIWPSKETLFDR